MNCLDKYFFGQIFFEQIFFGQNFFGLNLFGQNFFGLNLFGQNFFGLNLLGQNFFGLNFFLANVAGTWHSGTLFLPLEQTTTHVWPGKDSEQYPGNPGQVTANTSKPGIFLIVFVSEMFSYLGMKQHNWVWNNIPGYETTYLGMKQYTWVWNNIPGYETTYPDMKQCIQ
jgi:hypothetical protein